MTQITKWNGMPVQSTATVFQPEQNPYKILFADITHRCNMACKNCYLPNRNVPDMDTQWLRGILERLPNRTRIRLIGAEPTVRKDLPAIIAMVRSAGHIPNLLTNGLKLADREYVRSLKKAGLRTCYLSFNGGFEDDLYEAIDGQRCAREKSAALDNLIAENFYTILGAILVRGVNESVVAAVAQRIRGVSQVKEYHLRSVGAIGRHMDEPTPYVAAEMRRLAQSSFGDIVVDPSETGSTCMHGRAGGLQVQVTEWPDLGSRERGRISPDGTVQPFFEHVIANESGY